MPKITNRPDFRMSYDLFFTSKTPQIVDRCYQIIQDYVAESGYQPSEAFRPEEYKAAILTQAAILLGDIDARDLYQ